MISIQMKYVITNIGQPICFPESINHNEFARFGIRSAGFFYIIDANTVSVYGESISLGIKSRAEDAEILKRYLLN